MQNARIPTIILYFIKQCQVFAQGTNFSPPPLAKDNKWKCIYFYQHYANILRKGWQQTQICGQCCFIWYTLHGDSFVVAGLVITCTFGSHQPNLFCIGFKNSKHSTPLGQIPCRKWSVSVSVSNAHKEPTKWIWVQAMCTLRSKTEQSTEYMALKSFSGEMRRCFSLVNEVAKTMGTEILLFRDSWL